MTFKYKLMYFAGIIIQVFFLNLLTEVMLAIRYKASVRTQSLNTSNIRTVGSHRRELKFSIFFQQSAFAHDRQV